jgi:type IV fimbrial biogenesis protein FimT
MLGALTMTSRIRTLRAGFTLIELLIVVAIAAVLLALVAPSFTDMIAMQRLRGAHDQLATDVQFARSEAARRGIPVHVRVQSKSAGGPACYILFTDRALSASLVDFSTACDCSQAPGSRCSAATTEEIKTVELEPFTGLDLTAINQSRVGFDPLTGAMLVKTFDSSAPPPTEFLVDTSLDSARRLRLWVAFSGRVRVCSPSGSSVKAAAC